MFFFYAYYFLIYSELWFEQWFWSAFFFIILKVFFPAEMKDYSRSKLKLKPEFHKADFSPLASKLSLYSHNR